MGVDRLDIYAHWPNDKLDAIQRELAGEETPLYLHADDVLRVLEVAEAVPADHSRGAVEALQAVEDWFRKPRADEQWPECSARLDEVLKQVHAALHPGGQYDEAAAPRLQASKEDNDAHQ